MSKKSKRKESLKTSIMILLLLAILLVSSTYAWFTANKTVTISTLEVQVEAKNGLQISTDATTWKAIISNSDITTDAYDGNTNQVPGKMEPVSTDGSISNGKLNMYYGTVKANDSGVYSLYASKETEAAGDTGKFIAFDVFLKVEKETQIALTSTSKVTFTEGTSDKGLQNAARVAFLVEGSAAATAQTSTITALSGATAESTKIWEPNIDVHTESAVVNARDTYGIPTETTDANQISYFGINQEIPEANAVPLSDTNKAGTYFSAVTPAIATKQGYTTDITNFYTLSAGITKMRIYMWVEGQDVDCENTASGSDISYDIQFAVVEGNS